MKENRKFTEDDKIPFKIWLVKNRLSVKDFAKRCGVTHQYIYNIMNGKLTVSGSVLATFESGGYSIDKGKGVDE